MSKKAAITFILLFSLTGVYAGTYSGGTGDPNNPYLISTPEDLDEIGENSQDWNKHFQLRADVDMGGFTGAAFNIIGSGGSPFTGSFDGNDHTVANFTYESTGVHNIGLFGVVDGAIKNLHIVDPNVDAGTGGLVGALIGYINGGIVDNCHVEGGYVSGSVDVGGLLGFNIGATIINCSTECTVTGGNEVGGLAGYNTKRIVNCHSTSNVSGSGLVGGLVGGGNSGEIINCSSAGEVSGTGWGTGGLIGYDYEVSGVGIISYCYSSADVTGQEATGGLIGSSYNTIDNSYATGSVIGTESVGGLAGEADGTTSQCYATGNVEGDLKVGGLVGSSWPDLDGISDCYSRGDVFGQTSVGGLIGKNQDDVPERCYSTGSVTGVSNVGGLIGENDVSAANCFWDVNSSGQLSSAGGISKTTAEMKTESTFTSAGWDFVNETANGTEDIWTIKEDVNYPEHVWPLVHYVGWDIVNFLDYAFFAEHWMHTDCNDVNDCNSTDLDFSGTVNSNDVNIFKLHWLKNIPPLTKASGPNPADGASGQPFFTALSWQAGENAISHNVYFGTDINQVRSATPTDPQFMANLVAKTWNTNNYDSDGLGYSKTYHWRIDEIGLWNSRAKGDVWSFTTKQQGIVFSEQKISDTQGSFTGTVDNTDRFGNVLCSIGDLDGDGVEDIAVGAREDDDGGTNTGAVWILFLNSDGTVKSHQKISDTKGGFTGAVSDGDRFGCSLASLGDFDNDGITDIVVGAYWDDDGGTNRGAVWILFLNSNGTVKSHQKISDTKGGFTGTLDNSDLFGYSVACLGDLDGDDVNDIAVCARNDDDGGTNRGAVWILFLNSNGTVKGHQKISDTAGGFTGTLIDTDYFGSSVCTIGDIDGDDVNDIAVGELLDDDGGTNRGAVWILFLDPNGMVKGHQKISDTQGGFTGVMDDSDVFGRSVAALDDLDGDGIEDICVGASGDDDGELNRGALWLLCLNTDGTVKSHKKISDTQGGFAGILDDADQFGYSVSKLDDLDGDGFMDLAVGAYGDDDGGTDTGAVWILLLDEDSI